MSVIEQKINDFIETYGFREDKRREHFNFERFCNYIALFNEFDIIDTDDDIKELVESGDVG